MSKGFVLFEKIPECCSECPFRQQDSYGTNGCMKKDKIIKIENVIENKPDWCPIREFPKEESNKFYLDEYYDGYDNGWNDLLHYLEDEHYFD